MFKKNKCLTPLTLRKKTTGPVQTSILFWTDGIKRFARLIAFQNWENKLLPDDLKNRNPLNIWRTVNNELTKEAID